MQVKGGRERAEKECVHSGISDRITVMIFIRCARREDHLRRDLKHLKAQLEEADRRADMEEEEANKWESKAKWLKAKMKKKE